MFDEENKTKTYKKVKSHKKVILDILWRKKEKYRKFTMLRNKYYKSIFNIYLEIIEIIYTGKWKIFLSFLDIKHYLGRIFN